MRISCIIPTCDRPDMLQKALRSVFAQTHPVDEIIVVDNGTKAPVIPQEYSVYVNVIHLPSRSGVSKARNAGATIAAHEIIAFLDDDDLWSPHYVENIMRAFIEGADCVISRLDQMKDGMVSPYKNADGMLTIENILMFNIGITGSSIALKKSVFSSVGGFDQNSPTSEDKSLVIELLRAGVRIRTLPLNQAIQRMHRGDRLTEPNTLATGIVLFTKKYRALMNWQTYFFNRRKFFRLRVDGGTRFAYIGLLIFALFYRLARLIGIP